MRIADVRVDRYGPLPGFAHECEANLEVFYGPNESGKTLLLEAVLQLLCPDVDAAMPQVSRVGEAPSGYVVVERNGSAVKLGDGTALGDVSDVTPRHLRNVFVVRDSDLAIADEHEFYDSITQQIGDLHTDEIAAIQERLVESGRLTSVGGRKLSAASDRDDAAEVRERATELLADVREYVEAAERDDVAAAERERVAVTADLRRCEEELAVQRAAETLDAHATLAERLETYEEATESLDAGVSRSTLDRLRELDREIDAATEDLEELAARRSSLREERDRIESDREAVDADLAPVERRAEEVGEVERALESFREARGESMGADRGLTVAGRVAVAGLGLGGIAVVLGRTLAAAPLVGIGALAAGWYGLRYRSVRATERRRAAVLQRARDAGLEVDEVADVGPAISAFRAELERLRERREQLERNRSLAEARIEDCDEEIASGRDQRREHRAEKERVLQRAGAATVEEYRERVERRERLERERDRAARSLADALGTPRNGDADPETRRRYWQAELDAMVDDVPGDVTADDHEPERLETLRTERERLRERREDLADRLAEHEDRLRRFDERIADVDARPFVGESVRLEARSLEGLREAGRGLERVVERIERDADVARAALDVFDDVRAEEERKIADLFGEGSRATEVFAAMTDGRYRTVTYDAAAKVLEVHREDGQVLAPRELSHGTRDQLYLAARVGLAEQLSNSEPGFFLMDDAFLPADRTRLREGFEVLRELADDGWQILYFTAKEEVGNDLVDAHDLRCRRLERLG